MFNKINISSTFGPIIFATLGAFLFATAFFASMAYQTMRFDMIERQQMITMTNSFTYAYGKSRSYASAVPAVFRRIGMEHFSQQLSESSDHPPVSIRMSGQPGKEMRTIEEDNRLKLLSLNYANRQLSGPVVENRFENGMIIGRTVSPSIANDASCVDCHNKELGAGTYELNDVMGITVVETDLTGTMWRHGWMALGVFTVSFMALFFFLVRERRRIRSIVRGFEARVHVEQLKAEAASQAEFLKSHDPLTGLANRAMFIEQLDERLKGDPKEVATVTVGLIDLDNFKTINDTLGHAVGDTVLTTIADRLTEILGPLNGLAARLGGDEFAIMINSTRATEDIGNEILNVIGVTLTAENNVIEPHASLGFVRATCVDLATSSELIKAADAALYAAKDNGKNAVQVFDDKIRCSLWRRAEIANLLPKAIENDELRVVLQPKIDLQTGDFYGFEALARWKNADEHISPGEFVPIAEQTGLARALDLTILRQAARFAVDAEKELGTPIPFSANLSALNFRNGDLAEEILDILWDTGYDPKHLTLELIESVAVDNWQVVEKVINTLRSHGVRASLDDFGTGFSSLSYLRKFGFEEIKVDREFIIDIAEDAETRFLFESIADLAKGLGSTIVVEGLETSDQVEIVRAQGGMIGQGYFFSRPLELEDAIAYLHAQHGSKTTARSA